MTYTSTRTLMGLAAAVLTAMLWLVTLPVKAGAGVAMISFI